MRVGERRDCGEASRPGRGGPGKDQVRDNSPGGAATKEELGLPHVGDAATKEELLRELALL